jgi:hypothetical protein
LIVTVILKSEYCKLLGKFYKVEEPICNSNIKANSVNTEFIFHIEQAQVPSRDKDVRGKFESNCT